MANATEIFTTTELRTVFSAFPSGVVAVCGLAEGVPKGIAASSFTSVSVDPPLVSLCIQRTSETWPVLRQVQRLGISVLAEHQGPACRALSTKRGDRFDRVNWTAHDDGAVVLRGASAWFSATLHAELDAGDHVVALMRVHDLGHDPSQQPLVFHRSGFHRLVVNSAVATSLHDRSHGSGGTR